MSRSMLLLPGIFLLLTVANSRMEAASTGAAANSIVDESDSRTAGDGMGRRILGYQDRLNLYDEWEAQILHHGRGLASSPSHSCHPPCSDWSGEVCSPAGKCVCPPDHVYCEHKGKCVKATSGNNAQSNCGPCGHDCGDGVCDKEVCKCHQHGWTYCPASQRCHDLTWDTSHCGKCGNACPADKMTCSLVSGSHTCSCPKGLEYCAASRQCVHKGRCHGYS